MVRRAALGAFVLSVAACSLFTDLGGFSAGENNTADAAAPVDADARDTSLENPPPLDAGGDADAGALGAACTPNANTFCESFDKSTLLDPARWGSPVLERGEVNIEPRADAPSLPNVLRTSINDSPANAAFAQILQTFPVTPAETATLDEDLFIDQIGTAYVDLSTLDLKTDGALYSLQLAHQNGEAFIEEYSKVGTAPAHSFLTQRTTAITIGAWHHITITLNKVVPRTYSLIIDGTTFFTRPMKDEAPLDTVASGKIRVAIGISYQSKGPAVKTFIDNVKVTWK